MDQSKRRNFLIGFAGLAVVIAVAVAVYMPKFPPEQASGAIGAVQKLHETQISAKDVILGDETVKKETAIVFGDYLNDAAKLQSFSANLGSMTAANRDQLQSISHDLQSHQADLQSHFVANADAAVGSMTQLLAHSSLDSKTVGSMTAELQSIHSDLSNRLESAQMDALNSRLANVAAEMQSHNLFARADLANAQAQLNSAASDLQSHTELNDKAVLGASQKLGSVADQLNDKAILGVHFASRADYLGSMALQAKTLENVQASLNSILMSKIENKADLQSHFANMAADLGSRASDLESKALSNMQDRLNNEAQMASMIQNMNAMVGSMSSLNSKTLGSKTLGSKTLDSKTLGSKTLDSKTLGSKTLDSKTLDSHTLASFDGALANVEHSLQNLDTQLQSHAVANMQAELGAISEHLDSAAQLQSRFANAANLGSKVENRADLGSRLNNQSNLGSKVENRADLGSRLASQASLGSKMENRGTLGSFQTYLNNMAQTLQSSTLGSKLQNRQDLANKASQLGSKSADLQSRSN